MPCFVLRGRKSLRFGATAGCENDRIFIFQAIFSCNNLISSKWRCRGVFTSMVAHVRDCVLCEWLWEMAVCWMASVVLGPRAHSDRSLLQILGPLVSLSAVCHAGWLFHLLAESSGVKSLSKNGLPLMTMWHMKWLLLYESLCVSPSLPVTVRLVWSSGETAGSIVPQDRSCCDTGHQYSFIALKWWRKYFKYYATLWNPVNVD